MKLKDILPFRKEDTILFLGMIFVVLVEIFCILLLDHTHKKNTEKESNQSYNEKFEKYKIVCHQCKGTGEYPTDVNKLMMDATMALFINKHLMVDKCDQCVKLSDGYDYCKVVNDRYQTLLKEYVVAGPKIAWASCNECMGMGQFTSQKPDGSYYTQEEYNTKHRK